MRGMRGAGNVRSRPRTCTYDGTLHYIQILMGKRGKKLTMVKERARDKGGPLAVLTVRKVSLRTRTQTLKVQGIK